MKTIEKIETHFKKIESINYENEYGGAYAYVQFLAYTRELLNSLRSFKSTERQAEAIEGINWLFNEYLSVKFTYKQKVIFENKLHEMKGIFNTIRKSINENKTQNPELTEFNYAKAA